MPTSASRPLSLHPDRCSRRSRRLVVEHRLAEDGAHEVAADLAYNLAKRAYKLEQPLAAPSRVDA